jgi:hypothetical protein
MGARGSPRGDAVDRSLILPSHPHAGADMRAEGDPPLEQVVLGAHPSNLLAPGREGALRGVRGISPAIGAGCRRLP